MSQMIVCNIFLNPPIIYSNSPWKMTHDSKYDFSILSTAMVRRKNLWAAAEGTVWGLQEVGPRAMQHASQHVPMKHHPTMNSNE